LVASNSSNTVKIGLRVSPIFLAKYWILMELQWD
jgi:hypothetical protein